MLGEIAVGAQGVDALVAKLANLNTKSAAEIFDLYNVEIKVKPTID